MKDPKAVKDVTAQERKKLRQLGRAQSLQGDAGELKAEFKSSTQVILINDHQSAIDHLLVQHVDATADDFEKLKKLEGTNRPSRKNVVFISMLDL